MSTTTVATDPFKYKEEDEAILYPKGFVGWAMDFNDCVSMKLYIANISEQMVEDMYLRYMTEYQVEYVNLHPSNPKKSAKAPCSGIIFHTITLSHNQLVQA